MKQVKSDMYDDYIHNGEIIYVHWQLFAHEINDYKPTYSERIEFTYKDIEVIEFYKTKSNGWYNITVLMCDMIDKLGKEKFNQFKKYYDDYKTLQEDYIVVNNNVYKPYINDSVRSGNLINYLIFIKMEDGKMLDGKTNINQEGMNSFHKEECNKDELIDMLKYRVKKYFKDNKVVPKERHLIKKKTEEYKKIVKWFNKNKILKYSLED